MYDVNVSVNVCGVFVCVVKYVCVYVCSKELLRLESRSHIVHPGFERRGRPTDDRFQVTCPNSHGRVIVSALHQFEQLCQRDGLPPWDPIADHPFDRHIVQDVHVLDRSADTSGEPGHNGVEVDRV